MLGEVVARAQEANRG
jgi:hypothetical protein